MKQNKIIPIRECSCCYELIYIEKEIFNCPNTKCTYVLCKNCIINLGKKTNSDQCPACRIKLPIHYKPIEIISERTRHPQVIIMNRNTNRRRVNETTVIEEECYKLVDECFKFCGEVIKCCCTDIKECSLKCKDICIIGFQLTLLATLWLGMMTGLLLIGHMVSVNLYPFIYCCMPLILSFIIGGIFGIMTILCCGTCFGACFKCCTMCNNTTDSYIM